MIRPPPRTTLPDPPIPSPTLFRSLNQANALLLADHPCVQLDDDVVVAGTIGECRHPVVAQRRGQCVGDRADVDAEVAGDVAVDLDVQLRRVQQRSEEHTSELQSLMRISYAVICLKKKITITQAVNSLHLYSTDLPRH